MSDLLVMREKSALVWLKMSPKPNLLRVDFRFNSASIANLREKNTTTFF